MSYSRIRYWRTLLRHLVILSILCLPCAGCGRTAGKGNSTAPVRYLNDDRWPEVVGQGATWSEFYFVQDRDYQNYIADHKSEYDWFAYSANGRSGVPFILLRLLPDLYPDIFGKTEENFSRFGYVAHPTESRRPLPLGLGWEKSADQSMHVVTLSCSACHIGFVRTEAGTVSRIVGGPNTRVDVRGWRHAFEQAAIRIKQDGEYKTSTKLRELINSKPGGYFFGGRGSLGEQLDAQSEVGERQFVATAAEPILHLFVERTLAGQAAVEKQKRTSYSKANAPPLDGGSPGQSDGSGDLIPKLLQFDLVRKKCGEVPTESCGEAARAAFDEAKFPALPIGKATVTDIMSTWRQSEHSLAQIDGTVKSPFYRNIAAILAIVGDPRVVNVENAKISARFLSNLPPPPYPFNVDMDRAGRGRRLFQTHCAYCHRPQNTIVYKPQGTIEQELRWFDRIGTDPNRAQVLNKDALDLFARYFRESVPETFSIRDESGKTQFPRRMSDDDILIDRTEADHQGYVTDALEGLWARAPYLHNGSVPTVYQLLVPVTRPKEFVRGSISYDTKNVGWRWDLKEIEHLRMLDPQVVKFNTKWDSASNIGHDHDLTVDSNGRILRQDWEGPPRENEHKVRLNWSEVEHEGELFDLLEYLKTL